MMTCHLENSMEEIQKLHPFVLDCISKYGLPAGWEMRLNLALEEAVANVILYAFDDTARHEICVDANRANDSFMLVVIDAGRAFNPLAEAPETDVTLNAEERKIGGLGIHLIRNLADDVIYSRENGLNKLKLIFFCR